MNNSSTASPNAIIFQYQLPNQLTALRHLSPWLEQCANTIGLSVRGTFRLQLLLEEVALNIVQNAYGDRQLHLINISLSASESGLILRIEDDGLPFDQTIAPEKPVITDLETMQIGGLGLHLISAYSDHQDYQRHNDKNILTLQITDSEQQEFA